MPRLSINQLTTYRWTFEEDLHYAKRTGYDAVGLWRRKLSDFGEERALELLEESGLEVSCLNWAGGFTGGDGRSSDESIADGLTAVWQAAAVRANCLIVYAGGRNNHIDRHATRLLRLALDELLVVAELAGVVLAIKPMHAKCAREWSFQTDLEDTLELVAGYDTPHLRIVYDNYQFPRIDQSPALLAELLPYLALVQLGDARQPHSIDQQRCPLGKGNLGVCETVRAFQAAGYRGYFDIELMGDEIEASHSNYEPLLRQAQELIGRRQPATLRPTPTPASPLRSPAPRMV